MPTVLALDQLGARGTSIEGSTAGDRVGSVASAAGDFNGDGFDDVITTVYLGGPDNREQAYVVYGSRGGLNGVDLAHLLPSQGFAVEGDLGTYTVSDGGDVNGDGFDDIIIGKAGSNSWYYGPTGPAHAYVIFGRAGVTSAVNLNTFEPSDGLGFVINESTSSTPSQFSVSSAGDVNGDGYADILIGASSEKNGDGAAYVIFGKPSGLGTIELSDLASTTGFLIKGAPGGSLGASVSAAGDVNGDGYGDVIIGAPRADLLDEGAAYVIFGKAGGFGTIDVTALTASQGYVIRGNAPFDDAGWDVSAAGDVNGDGYDDIIVGAPFHDDGGQDAGQAYVIFGRAGNFSNIDLANLGSAGFSIRGDVAGDWAGWSVAGAGDVNNDGFDDIIIGAPQAQGSGAAYLIFGKAGGFGTIDLTDLASATGLVLQGGATGDYAGNSVSGAGDVNGDGYADVIVGAPLADLGGTSAGEVYIVSGTGPLAPVHNDFNGDSRSDILWRGDNGLIFNWVAANNGAFASNADHFSTTVSSDSHVVGTADFNGDGVSDILWRQDVTGRLYDWLGTASGGFVNNIQHSESSLPSSVQIVGTGDFNGDGRHDVLMRSDTGLLFDWLGQADGGFASNTANFATIISTEWRVISTGDFNGDGRDDILWRQDGTGHLLDWLGAKDGGFSTNTVNFDSSMPSTIQFAGTGDFNGDGIDDVLWRDSSGLLFDWLGTAKGGFASNAGNFSTVLATDWKLVSVGDFNADGRDDVLLRQDGTGHLLDWLGTAQGSFVTNSQNFESTVPNGLMVEDPFI